jgi:hypothetical protein
VERKDAFWVGSLAGNAARAVLAWTVGFTRTTYFPSPEAVGRFSQTDKRFAQRATCVRRMQCFG